MLSEMETHQMSNTNRSKTGSAGTWMKLLLLAVPLVTASGQYIVNTAVVLNSPTPAVLTVPCAPGATLPTPGCASSSPAPWGIPPTITGNASAPGWGGTWVGTIPAAAPSWQGPFTTTGLAYPSSSPSGILVWNFTSLPYHVLPPGTYINFGDLDNGSANAEEFQLTALDRTGMIIKTPWLNGPIFASATNCVGLALASVTDCVQASMPEYVWAGASFTHNTSCGTYTVPPNTYEFDGCNVIPNPTLTVWLTTNVEISSLTLTKNSSNNSFGIAAPPAVPYIEVCKASSPANPVTGIFNFTLTSASATAPSTQPISVGVPAGTCSGPIQVPAGNVTITETEPPGVTLSAVTATGYNLATSLSENRLVSFNLAAGTAVVTAVAGDVSNETVATFTNQGPSAQLKICKIAGPGITVGTNFGFTATSTSPAVSQRYTVPAGPASEGGYCVIDSTTFPVGANVTVAEAISAVNQMLVTSSVFPAGATGGSSIVATLGTGFTEVRFTNSRQVVGPLVLPFNLNLNAVSFDGVPTGTPLAQTIAVASTPSVPFTAVASISSGPAGWLTVNPPTGQTPAALTASVSALPAGTYTGAITITSTDTNNPFVSTVPVTFTVAAAGQFPAGFNPVGSMAQLAFAGGWNTSFTLINTGTSPVQASLNFFGGNGNPLAVPLVFPQSGAAAGPTTTTTVTVNPGAEQLVQTAGLASQPTQSGWTQVLATGNLSGFAVFQFASGASVQEAVVPLESRNPTAFELSFDNTGGYATGIALANVSMQAASIPMVIRNDTGATLLSTTIQLAADGYTSFVLGSTYAVTAGVRGTVEFDTPSGGQISVLGIRANPTGAYTTVPAVTK